MKEITTKSSADLDKMLKEKREELRLNAFGVAGSKAKNVKLVSALKKDIARILTHKNNLRLKK
ncbi:MAG TPA: 50S ribosomal protein L29 [Candidatus Paceibacterota bacterium]|nr:50S ribosomal protein L29 [Candidatus Paceibacterota bacterium]